MVKSKKNIFFVITILIIFIQIISYPIISMGDTKSTKESTSSSTSAGQIDGDKLGLGILDEYKGTRTSSLLFQKKLKVVFTVLRILGTVLSVVILIVIGLKYMLGSVEEKADYKKTLIPYIIGTAFLFATTLLPQIIYDFMINIGWL